MKKIIAVVLIFFGVCMILYKPVMDKIDNNIQNQLKNSYKLESNKSITYNTEQSLVDVFEDTEDEDVGDDIEVNNDVNINEKITTQLSKKVIGNIKIDCIDVDIPIMESISNAEMRVGAGHMPNTSMPGEVGNCTLVGHRRYTTGKLFNRLGEICIGDTIEIDYNNNNYTYTVYDIFVVEPTELYVLEPVNQTEKTLTLITCHPFKVNTHRLIVRAKCE